MKVLKGITSLLVVICLMFGSIPTFAHSVVLPDGQVLSDDQLEGVEGEGPSAGLVAGVATGVGSGLAAGAHYVGEYLWDKYVTKSDPTFSSNELAKSVSVSAAAGFVGGFVMGTLLPTP